MLNWRLALPLAGAAVLLALSFIAWRSGVPAITQTNAPAAVATKGEADLPPTMGNYEMVANRSLEKLDELVTEQGNRNPPSAQFIPPRLD